MKFFNFIKRFSACILGGVFLIGGLFKLMDPVGSGLVMESYFSFLHIPFLNPFAELIAFIFNLLECGTGIAMISGIWVPIVRIVSLVMLSFFTLLTLLLLIFNPDMDCGCFGEVVHMTHFQSFAKNIGLFILWLLAYIPFLKQHHRPLYRKICSGVAFLLVIAFGIYPFRHLPIKDHTDLRTGTELSEGSIPLLNEDGEYNYNMLMRGRVLILSIENEEKADHGKLLQARDLAKKARIRPIIASSAGIHEDCPLKAAGIPVFGADRRTLLSLNRANGGATFISGGQIARKWNLDDFLKLDEDKLKEIIATDPSELIVEDSINGSRIFEILAMILLVLLLI